MALSSRLVSKFIPDFFLKAFRLQWSQGQTQNTDSLPRLMKNQKENNDGTTPSMEATRTSQVVRLSAIRQGRGQAKWGSFSLPLLQAPLDRKN